MDLDALLDKLEPRSYPLFGVPIVYVTTYRPRNKGGMTDVASRAIWAFKDGHPEWVKIFAAILANVAKRSSFVGANTVVAALASGELTCNPQSRLGAVVNEVSAALGVQPDFELMYKVGTHFPFHVPGASEDGRRRTLRELVRCHPAKGKRVVVIDDIITFGTTMEVYREKINDAGGTMIGGLAIGITRRDKTEEAPNAWLFHPSTWADE